MKKRHLLIFGLMLVCFPCFSRLNAEKNVKKKSWVKVSCDSFTLILSKNADTETLYGRIWARRLKEQIRMEKPETKTDKEKLKLLIGRMSAIFEQVQKLRKQSPELKGNERIVILQNRTQLRKMFIKLYGRDYPRGISFYSSRVNTVFTTEDVINAQILAHEMTHMVNFLAFGDKMDEDDDEDSAYTMETYFRK